MTATHGLDVSRETLERLKTYDALLRKWNPRINLVARSTIDDLWQRHFQDSAQIYDLASHPLAHWADLGSGGGFPGLVIAIMACETGSPARTTLVESDTRKCAFLRSVIRETGVRAEVVNDRIEGVAPLQADVLSARALAPLTDLLGYAERHLAPGGIALFPKGEAWKKELSAAQSKWKFRYGVATSKTNDDAVILSVTGVTRV